MDTLIDHNRSVIKELYNILSLYNTKYSLKYKFSEDPYKSLKSAIKLEKEMGNKGKDLIDEIEKENLIDFNNKQLQLSCAPAKVFKEIPVKYYNIKHVQVE